MCDSRLEQRETDEACTALPHQFIRKECQMERPPETTEKHERCCTTLQTVQSSVPHRNRNTATPVHSAVSTEFFPFQAGFRSTQVLLIGSCVIVCVMIKSILMLLQGFHYMMLRKL